MRFFGDSTHILIKKVFKMEMEVSYVIGENIRKYRTYKNLTQEQLGQAVHKSSSVIANWERSRNAPSVYDIINLCEYFKCTPNDLFGYNEQPEVKSYLEEYAKRLTKLAALRKQKADVDEEIRYWSNMTPKP